MENGSYASPQELPVASPPLEGQQHSFRVNLPPHQVPCRYFLSGYCARSDSCWFQHEVQGLKIQKLKLKTVVKLPENNAEDKTPLLPSEAMVQGQGKAALRQWRTEFWSAKMADARANKRKLDVEKQGPASKRSKVMRYEGMPVLNDTLGEPARKVARAKEERKVVLVKEEVEEPGVPIPTDPEACPICTETPKVFGLMSHCDHIFCLECIRSWRSADKVNKTCPICRTKSSFVVPSSVYPYRPGRKADSPTPEKNATEKNDNPSGSTANGEGPSSSGQSRPKLSSLSTVKDGTDINGGPKDGGVKEDGEIPSKQARPHKKRTRKKNQPKPDPNPAKTRIVQNYLAKMKTIPCKYFCDPKQAKVIKVRDKWQSLSWGTKNNNRRKIPFCKYGNECHYSHPHPEKVEEEYKYTHQELDRLGIMRRTPGHPRHVLVDPEDFIFQGEALEFFDASDALFFWRHPIEL